MGIIGVEKSGHLYWLGRYTERVFTTLKTFFKYYDSMIEQKPEYYKTFCKRLSIPNIYGSKDEFVKAYLFDKNNVDSIYANLLRAYDNAVVMRNDLSSECLAYVQMALDLFEKEKENEAPLVALQPVIDVLFAFWGSVDDYVESEEMRNIIKCGKLIERIDLYIRLNLEDNIPKEVRRLKARLEKSHLKYNAAYFTAFEKICERCEFSLENRKEAVQLLESII